MSFLLYVITTFALSSVASDVVKLNSTNWKQVFNGNWFIEFYAPWCPACRQFSSTWLELSNEPNLNSYVAAVDVTECPVLSFAFFIKRLPTLYHSRDGIFRLYDGSRFLDDLKAYLQSEKYEQEVPIPWYYSPASLHMQTFVRFMDFGLLITNIHQSFVDSGYPPWLSFLIIGCGTMLFGLLLGLLLVSISDCLFPPRPQILRLFKEVEKPMKSSSTDEKSNCTNKDEISDDEFVEVRRRSPDSETKK